MEYGVGWVAQLSGYDCRCLSGREFLHIGSARSIVCRSVLAEAAFKKDRCVTHIPEDFKPLETASPFNQMAGPFYGKTENDQLTVGLRILETHCNTSGRLHGAMFAAIADTAIGHNIGLAVFGKGTGAPVATVNLSLDYSGYAVLGDWVEISVTSTRRVKHWPLLKLFSPVTM